MALRVQNIRNIHAASNGYMVNLVRMDKEKYSQKLVRQFLCYGYDLPKEASAKYEIEGTFEKNEKGYRFKVVECFPLPKEEVDQETVEKIIEAVMSENELYGNTCFETLKLVEAVENELIIRHQVAQTVMINKAIITLISKKILQLDRAWIFRRETLECEKRLAFHVSRLLLFKNKENNRFDKKQIEKDIAVQEKRLKTLQAREQKNAIIRTLTHPFSILTGEPGTGKTTTVRMITNIYLKSFPNHTIRLISPTGKAASELNRGLQEHIDAGTQEKAKTIHSKLGLIPTDNGFTQKEKHTITDDFVIIDECSMIDMQLAEKLFASIQNGTKVLLMGDVNQLESIGLGKVLYDLIHSHVIPVTTLNQVFRQKAESRIAINARRILRGLTELEFGEDFRHIECLDYENSAQTIIDQYLNLIKEAGTENVMILSPYRKYTATGVNQLNPRIRDIVNPPSQSRAEMVRGGKCYRENDRVVFMKNNSRMYITNGETGKILMICGNMMTVELDKTKEKIQFAQNDDSMQIDWAYALTVYKSQGSEYAHCIITLQNAHFNVKRNLIYTAITRAKEGVVIVGEMAAVEAAILNAGGSGETRLKERLIELKHVKKGGKPDDTN